MANKSTWGFIPIPELSTGQLPRHQKWVSQSWLNPILDEEDQGSLWSQASCCCADVGTHKHCQQSLYTDVRAPLCRGLVRILYSHWKPSRNFQDEMPSLPKQWVQSKFGCVCMSSENKAELAHWDAKELSGPMADAPSLSERNHK